MLLDADGESISEQLRSGIHSIPMSPLPESENLMTLNDMITQYDPTIDDSPPEWRAMRHWTLE